MGRDEVLKEDLVDGSEQVQTQGREVVVEQGMAHVAIDKRIVENHVVVKLLDETTFQGIPWS